MPRGFTEVVLNNRMLPGGEEGFYLPDPSRTFRPDPGMGDDMCGIRLGCEMDPFVSVDLTNGPVYA